MNAKSDGFRVRARRLREEATRAIASLRKQMVQLAEQYEELAEGVDRSERPRSKEASSEKPK